MATRRLSGIASSSSVPDNGGDHSGGGGSAGGVSDDVFSTYVYTGTSSGRAIVNGIDLAGEGGMVWIKNRSSAANHQIADNENNMGTGNYTFLSSNTTDPSQYAPGSGVQEFKSDGFIISGGATTVNAAGQDYVSWTFRKAKNFFDVVTYTGDGTAGREIPHNLGSTPGMMIVKCIDDASGWAVYHMSLGATKALLLNTADSPYTLSSYWNDTEPTDSVFTLGAGWNTNNRNFVMYLFAHDDSDESIIKCGSYTGDGTSDLSKEINLGWEPQFLMIKPASYSGDGWFMFDTMRGIVAGGNEARLYANDAGSENAFNNYLVLTSTGFAFDREALNTSSAEYIYVAIRRPTKHASEFEPEELFDANTYMGNAITNKITNTVDFAGGGLVWIKYSNDSKSHVFQDTVRGVSNSLFPDIATGESRGNNTGVVSFDHDGFTVGGNGDETNQSGGTYWSYSFRRAPGFFDVVGYTGTGSTRTVSHNLGVAPEMMIFKTRSSANGWVVYHSALGNTKALMLHNNGTPIESSDWFNDTDPTDSVFTVGSGSAVSENNFPLISYHFASVPGISKVGSYTGTGGALDIDCGFTNGARFVLIKRTDSTGDWVAFDYERGIVANGFDPYVKVNTNDFVVSNNKMLNPYAAGFSLDSTHPSTNMDGGQFIFYAIA